MIKNMWYAVLDSSTVKKKPVGVKRLGMNLVFFRDRKGALSCVEDLCAHRGAALSGGCMNENHIRCPFHGIEYDQSGKCVFIPSEGKSSTEDFSRFQLQSFPVREIGGIVFLWYGSRAPEGEPDIFPILNDSRFSYSHLEDVWAVHYSRVIENQLDVSHLAFVHHNTIGRGNKTLSNGPKVVWIDENTFQTSANNEVDTGQRPKSAEESEIKVTNLNFKYPNLWLNHINDKLCILAFFVPVDDDHTVLCVRFYDRFTGFRPLNHFIAWIGKFANKIVERQDKRVVETQRPKKSVLRMQEKLVAADLPIIEYRVRRDALLNPAPKVPPQ